MARHDAQRADRRRHERVRGRELRHHRVGVGGRDLERLAVALEQVLKRRMQHRVVGQLEHEQHVGGRDRVPVRKARPPAQMPGPRKLVGAHVPELGELRKYLLRLVVELREAHEQEIVDVVRRLLVREQLVERAWSACGCKHEPPPVTADLGGGKRERVGRQRVRIVVGRVARLLTGAGSERERGQGGRGNQSHPVQVSHRIPRGPRGGPERSGTARQPGATGVATTGAPRCDARSARVVRCQAIEGPEYRDRFRRGSND